MKLIPWRKMISMTVCCFLVAMALVPVAFAAESEKNVVSYGLQVLSAQTDVSVSAPVGNEIVFSADLFARGLNLSRVTSITVQTLPPVTDGELLLGSTRIAEGQQILAENLPYVTFSASAEDMLHSSFTFVANEGRVPMVCNLYFTDQANYTPTVSMASGLSLRGTTFKNMELYGTMSAYDPDGDTLIFEVVSYPQNGSVKVVDREAGTYVYTPYNGYVGTDSFSYVARDLYGNYSASAKINLRIEQAGTRITYVDMADSAAHISALKVTQAGIMSGTRMGKDDYFYPESSVTRADFLVMAMRAAGITEVPAVTQTVFSDDGDIAENVKGYVAAAYTLGYISGTNVAGELCFLPDEEITRAQAAVMVGSILGLSEVSVIPTIADSSEIPVWARDAVYSLYSEGLMECTDGAFAPTAKITRAQTAQLLAAMLEYEKE